MSPNYASPADITAYGEYRIVREPGDTRPLYRFSGRIGSDGSAPFRAERGRYHLYAGWFCPWSQRATITRELAGLRDVVSVSYVHGERDARGWAFRESTGPDPVNGFTLLRDAYEHAQPGFDGHISVPTLWDRASATVVSNDFTLIGIDLATQFGELAANPIATYPDDLQADIDELDAWIGPAVNTGAQIAAGEGEQAVQAHATLLDTFAALDERLATSRYLLGDRLTQADVRLWVTLVRYDVAINVGSRINPGLAQFRHLWAYARDLYQQPAFTTTTRFASFAQPGVPIPDWDSPHGRERLSASVLSTT